MEAKLISTKAELEKEWLEIANLTFKLENYSCRLEEVTGVEERLSVKVRKFNDQIAQGTP
jgi:hypothetical protein